MMDMAVKFVRKAKIDAYVMTMYKNQRLKTKVLVQEEGGAPVNWNQEIWLPAQLPIISSRIILKLMDLDNTTSETAGSLRLDAKDIIEGKYNEKFIWKNIYGSPLNQRDSKFKEQMNDNPELASNWKGRILM